MVCAGCEKRKDFFVIFNLHFNYIIFQIANASLLNVESDVTVIKLANVCAKLKKEEKLDAANKVNCLFLAMKNKK